MKRRSYAKRRDSNEKEVVRALEKIGCSVLRLDDFDLLVGYRGRDFKIEVKSEKGTKTESQVEMIENWRGSPLYIVRSIDQAIALVSGV